VQKKYLGEIMPSSHRVISNRSYFFKSNDVKSGCINYLPLGSQICVKDFDDLWAKVYLGSDQSQKIAYIPKQHIIKNGEKISDWVSIAEKLIGTPYVWGGRNSIGLDCSALLQLSYQAYGENIPRNSIDQSLLNKKIIKNKEKLKRGFVIFWKGHVGIMVDESHCIHANAFHMEVSREPLVTILERSGEYSPILKIMNFN
jgi:cell wall-associated NlpC family hydrolase